MTKNLAPQGFPDLPMLFPALLVSAFQELRIGASTCVGNDWRALYYYEHSVTDTEVELGVQPLRHRYNLRCLAEARSTTRMVHGEHGGFHDLFVPLVKHGVLEAILVVGPFTLARPTSAELIDRWYRLTGAPSRITDPAFARYFEATLSTLTLDGALFPAFRRMVQCLAQVVERRGDPHRLSARAERLRVRLLEARFADRMWAAARDMVDDRTAHTWSTGLKRDPLAAFGLRGAPRHVLVGLILGRNEGDPVDEALRREAFQRACVQFARRRGHVISGRVGDRGVTLLGDHADKSARARASFSELAVRLSSVARQHGLRLHVGIATAQTTGSLPTRYRLALAAAEKALARDASIEFADVRPDSSAQALRHLRASLAVGVEEQPSHLSARFERYVDAVLSHTGYRVEAARGHLQAGLERLAEPLLAASALDARSVDDIFSVVDAGRDPDSVADLVLAYRRAVADIERATEQPTTARQERSTRRALAYIDEHLAEPLTLGRVARVAGFAPDYFSRLLRDEEGSSFEQYLQQRRLERAKQLLTATALGIGRVSRLSGFRSRTYFQRLFREATGKTPMDYRRE